MKILFVSADKFPPFRVDVSVLFGEEIVKRGHTVDFLLQSDQDSRFAYTTKWSDCNVFVGASDNKETLLARTKKNLLDILNDFRVFQIMRKKRYDFLIVKDKFLPAVIMIIASILFKVKYIYWLSYPFPEDYIYKVKEGIARYPIIYFLRGNFSKFLLYKIIIPFSAHTFVQSQKMKTDILSEGVHEDKMTPVPMGVSIDKIPYFGYSAINKTSSDKKSVCYLGTIARERRMDFIIRAFKKIKDKINNVQLIIVGAGDDPSDELMLIEEANRMGIKSSVRITGFLSQNEAWNHIRFSDICVSPFYPTFVLNSTSPTKLIEYMAMGKAVVANDHPEQNQVISESKAGICVPYEEEAFAGAIVYLLNHPNITRTMGRRGRRYVEKYRSYEILAGLLENKLQEILNLR